MSIRFLILALAKVKEDLFLYEIDLLAISSEAQGKIGFAVFHNGEKLWTLRSFRQQPLNIQQERLLALHTISHTSSEWPVVTIHPLPRFLQKAGFIRCVCRVE